MYGYRYDALFKSLSASGPSIDPDAQSYYDALNTANGGQVDYNSIYGVSDAQALTNFSDHFVSLKADGIYSKLVHYYPFFGGTGATHAICAVDFSSEITYAGAPTHTSNGVILNGTTQYVDTGVIPFNDMSRDDNHIMMLLDNSTDIQYSSGAISDASTNSFWVAESGGNKITDNTGAGIIRLSVANTVKEKVLISTRTSLTDVQIYVDGSSIGTNSNTNTNTLTTNNLYFGARNFNGTADVYSTGDLRSASLGQGLNATDALNFTTHIKSLQTAFSR